MNNPWNTLTVVFLIALYLILVDRWSFHWVLTMVILLLIGGIIPPLGLGLSLLILVGLVLRHGVPFLSNPSTDNWQNFKSRAFKPSK